MIIGLTGGIGSGKSTVLDYLKDKYDADIIQSDYVAKEIMTPGHKVFDEVAEQFPQVIKDGIIDSYKLSEIVFKNQEKLKILNAITHPGTVEEIILRIHKSHNIIIVVESALLMDSGLEPYIDEVWFVYCELEERINRLIRDRGYTKEKAEKIIKSQSSDEEYNKSADEFIDNSFSQEKTREQIDLILSPGEC